MAEQASGGFWDNFSLSQLVDVGAKVFTTNAQTDAQKQQAQLTAIAAAQNANAKNKSTALWNKWLPIGLGVVVLGILAFVGIRAMRSN